eukprot:scaffold2229_cov262-Pinguiococcus_pyrenoidosus.AAC.14
MSYVGLLQRFHAASGLLQRTHVALRRRVAFRTHDGEFFSRGVQLAAQAGSGAGGTFRVVLLAAKLDAHERVGVLELLRGLSCRLQLCLQHLRISQSCACGVGILLCGGHLDFCGGDRLLRAVSRLAKLLSGGLEGLLQLLLQRNFAGQLRLQVLALVVQAPQHRLGGGVRGLERFHTCALRIQRIHVVLHLNDLLLCSAEASLQLRQIRLRQLLSLLPTQLLLLRRPQPLLEVVHLGLQAMNFAERCFQCPTQALFC